mmetsp:Transcript_4298/g.7926  ORF Transcript_4298/g.7926 Transcript_4298/m.7926 type:complete len:394 (-) Transcript_4298:428-1609(-)
MEHVMEASRLYLSKAKRSYPIQPDTIRSSHPSPRKAKALNRLSTPRTREDNNMNNTVDTFGSRVIMPSKIEETYADILDDISDEVYVPSYMRQKMISAIIETENPKAYQMMKHFKAPFMTCSNEKKARMQRHKPLMCKPRTLNKDPRKFQTICAQDKISSQDIFTEKLIKVMLILRHKDNKSYQLNLQSREQAKASLRSVHIKVVVSSYFGSILQSAKRNFVRRERKLLYERLLYEQKCIESQKRIAKKWRQYLAYVKAKAIIDEMRSIKNMELKREQEDEQLFLDRMKQRMNQENTVFTAWRAKNMDISLVGARGRHCDENEPSVGQPGRNIPPIENSSSHTPGMPGRPNSISKGKAARDPHIDALMLKYGNIHVSNQDGLFRKKRFFDIQL